MQKLIPDDKKYTMEKLLTALQSNCEVREVMHQDFLHVPKHGSDDDYAGDWVVKFLVSMDDTISAFKEPQGYSLAENTQDSIIERTDQSFTWLIRTTCLIRKIAWDRYPMLSS